MRLENILALTHAKLINEPCVNSFESIVFDVKKIKRGDLFMVFDTNDVEEAVHNGAYGIVFDKPVQVNDAEIAWIQVNSVEDALKRLLRFKMIEKEIVAYKCNDIVLKLALQIITPPNFLVLDGDIKSIFNSLWHAQERAVVLFCPAPLNKNIFTTIKTLPKTAIEPIKIMEQTLFETSFIYNDKFYERRLVSPFFIPFLEELLHLYKSLKIDFRLKKFIPIDHFEAVFTNKNFEIKEFGTSDKVLIFEKNSSLIAQEIDFLQKNASWANIIFILPSHHAKEYELYDDVLTYNNEKEIVDILKNNTFHFALIVGVDKSILSKPLTNQKQLALDFEQL
jgi:ferrochelatase